MTIKQIYDLAIQMGVKSDLRGGAAVGKKLQREKEKFKKLSEEQKREFDEESMTNPYADTRVYFGDPKKVVKRVMTGIDIDTGEVMIAKFLSQHEKPIDLIIAHHPMGAALAGLGEMLEMHAELLAKYGVPINIAESLTHIRMSEVARGLSPVNHNRVLDAAKLLGLNVMCVHTPSDNLVANFLDREIKKHLKNIETVGELLDFLKTIPEYQQAIKQKSGPRLFSGKESNYTGKIALTEITGGTEGGKEIYQHIAASGIGTIVGMHMKEDNRLEAEKAHLNILIAGHMSSDSIGMNLFLDELEKRGVEVITGSGLIRVKR